MEVAGVARKARDGTRWGPGHLHQDNPGSIPSEHENPEGPNLRSSRTGPYTPKSTGSRDSPRPGDTRLCQQPADHPGKITPASEPPHPAKRRHMPPVPSYPNRCGRGEKKKRTMFFSKQPTDIRQPLHLRHCPCSPTSRTTVHTEFLRSLF